MELTTTQEMAAYLEEKFSSLSYKATAETQESFGPVVKFYITWTPLFPEGDTIKGPMWVAPNGYTAAVPFNTK